MGLGLGAYRNMTREISNSGGQIGAMDLGAEQEAARTDSETALATPENALLFTGLGFLSIAVGSLLYGLLVSRIRR